VGAACRDASRFTTNGCGAGSDSGAAAAGAGVEDSFTEGLVAGDVLGEEAMGLGFAGALGAWMGSACGLGAGSSGLVPVWLGVGFSTVGVVAGATVGCGVCLFVFLQLR